MKIIAIAGTNGSGKDTVAEILEQKYGYLFVSVADLLRDEARRRGQPIEREVLRTISAQWRREYGLGVLVDRAVEQFKEYGDKYKGLAVSPMRNAGEAARAQELGGVLVWVDADPKIRYDRITKRRRSAEDNKTYEQFLAEEQAEMHSSGDAATLNMSAVKEKAGVFIDNNFATIEEFMNSIEEHLERIV